MQIENLKFKLKKKEFLQLIRRDLVSHDKIILYFLDKKSLGGIRFINKTRLIL